MVERFKSEFFDKEYFIEKITAKGTKIIRDIWKINSLPKREEKWFDAWSIDFKKPLIWLKIIYKIPANNAKNIGFW